MKKVLVCSALGLALLTRGFNKARVIVLVRDLIAVYVRLFGIKHPLKKLTIVTKSDVASGYQEPSAELIAFSKLLSLNISKGKPTVELCRKTTESAADLVTVESPFKKIDHHIDVKGRRVEINEIIAEDIPEEFKGNRSPAIVYIHGGGYICGSPRTHMGFLVKLARTSRCRIFAVDYNLCPEITFLDQIQECVAAYHYTCTKAENVALAGDSAGGGMVLHVLQDLVANQKKMPRCSLMISPYVDFTASSESCLKNIDDALVQPGLLQVCKECCVPQGMAPTDPKVNALFRSFKGIENVYIIASETEALYSDAAAIYSKLKNETKSVIFESAPYGVHVFPVFERFAPEYNETFLNMCSFLREALLVDRSFKLYYLDH